MQKLTVKLQGCYGIAKLHHEFDFSKHPTVAIYAPNGSMKSSFALTFDDYKKDRPSGDRHRPGSPWSREFLDETGKPIDKDSIFVISPYENDYESAEDVENLLIHKDFKKQCTKLSKERDDAKKAFIRSIKELSKSSKSLENLEKEISSAFTPKEDRFFEAIGRIKEKVIKQKEELFSDVQYDDIFSEEVVKFLSEPDVKKDIESYIRSYNQLLDKSTYFRRGIFNFYSAETIADALEKHGWFKAEHTVNLRERKIENKKQLIELIEGEKKGIFSNEELRAKWEVINKKIMQKTGLRAFYDYITRNEHLLAHLSDLREFKENTFISYFTTNKDAFSSLIGLHERIEKEIEKLQTKAAESNSLWEEVIRIYNDRFLYLPFKVNVLNKAQVATGQDKNLKIDFQFTDGGEPVSVPPDDLKQRLSTGERKAFYILHLIFDVVLRRESKEDTLFVVDDIADSFDYKNKYAIIEYLKDIADTPHFKQIILTHNFDFFRTITSREVVDYSQTRMTVRSKDEIKIEKAQGIMDVFGKDWKKEFFKNQKKRIACIPFMRNLVDYCDGKKDPRFLTLTALLHWMEETPKVTEEDLGVIFRSIFDESSELTVSKTPVIDSILHEANECLGVDEGVNFENKIVLAIAIRILAEKFMLNKITDRSAIKDIEQKSSRTPKLVKLYKKEFGESDVTRTLGKVVMMTPENIHLNSFMYEPILDMSDTHLKKLYKDVLALK